MIKKKHTYWLLVLTFGFTCINIVAQKNMKIIDKKVNFGYREMPNREIDVIIIHSVFNNSGGNFYDIDLIIKQFKRYKVNSHYLIGREGSVFQLVDDKNIASHAGKSCLPDGRTAVNKCSIGIELVTSYTESPTEEQTNALVELVNQLKSIYKINYILRHSDIAIGRKSDPWNFDWNLFNIKLSNYTLLK
jgi:N-acetyl-anhydromuramyl-L-alanine amidase AmpD